MRSFHYFHFKESCEHCVLEGSAGQSRFSTIFVPINLFAMKRYSLLTLAVLALCCFPGLFAQTFQTFPHDPMGVKKAVLPNGFEVYLSEDHSLPSIFGAVVVKAGGKYDPKDATGMGHYLEHMLFKGTQTLGTTDYTKEKPYLDRIDSLYEVLGTTTDEAQRKALQAHINENAVAAAQFAIPNEFDRLLESIGSEGVNAFTDMEEIVYHNSFPPNQVEKWLDIYAERFQNPVFRLFQSELETVYEEKNRAMDDFGYALLRKFASTFYKNHPYGQQDVIGDTDHLKNPSLTKMYHYFNTYYVANNMALVMSGDFDAEKIFPLIAEKFGALKRGNVPAYPEYPEAAFKGREYVTGRYTPVKAGIMGFRTVPNGHPDEPALELAHHLLVNEGETGFLNILQLDHKVLAAFMMPYVYNDHGAGIIIVIPKLIGQSTEKAEALILAELTKLKQGEFTDQALQAAKLKLRIDFERSLENNYARGLHMADAFTQGQSWDKFVSYPQQIDAVTREQVMEVARKYYGPNYLMFESKMGFPKKEKLEKPGFVAPKPLEEAQSPYAQRFQRLPEQQPRARFVDLQKDFNVAELGTYSRLYHTANPLNGIFMLRVLYGAGTEWNPMLSEATAYMNLAGTETRSTDSLKRSFELLGCTYSFQATGNAVIVECTGPEEHMVESLQLLAELIWHPTVDDKKIENIYEDAKSDRKFEAKSVQEMGSAALQYALYGDQSPLVRRLSLKTIRSLTAQQLIDCLGKAMEYGVEVHYSGRKEPDWVAEALQTQFFKEHTPSHTAQYIVQPRTQYTTPTILFLERKDAIQTQLHFFKESLAFDRDKTWLVDGFNEYFGGSMAGLVFQEIREFRSLAYSAGARIHSPQLPDGHHLLRGYIGCQADKTIEAMTVMRDLIQSMPAKPDRIPSIRRAAEQSAYMARPNFRNLTETVRNWQRLGWTADPYSTKVGRYPTLTWDTLHPFYQSALVETGTPIVWVLTGDPKRIDQKELAKFGKVVWVKESAVARR